MAKACPSPYPSPSDPEATIKLFVVKLVNDCTPADDPIYISRHVSFYLQMNKHGQKCTFIIIIKKTCI